MDEQQEQIPRSKQELLDFIKRDHDLLEGTMALLDADQMTAPLLDGGWAVKDIMAHLSFWEQYTIKRLRARSDAAALQQAAAELEGDSEDEVNDGVYRRNKDRPLAEVRADFNRSFEENVREVESLSQEDIFAQGRSALWDGEPIGRLIANNTYLHYQEHNSAIKARLEVER
jgi:hypothetical protein